jgi:hypothetical protein
LYRESKGERTVDVARQYGIEKPCDQHRPASDLETLEGFEQCLMAVELLRRQIKLKDLPRFYSRT